MREDVEADQEELTRLRAECERLKTVPMKYRRMAYNAQLQDENAALNAENAKQKALIEQFKKRLDWMHTLTEYEVVQIVKDFLAAIEAHTKGKVE